MQFRELEASGKEVIGSPLQEDLGRASTVLYALAENFHPVVNYFPASWGLGDLIGRRR